MDDPRISWWLAVLLTIGVAGLSAWQSSRWTLQVRLIGGSLALIYMGMLAVAVAGQSRGAVASAGGRPDWMSWSLCGISLVTAILATGRASPRGQLIWFGSMSLANAGTCIVTGSAGIGIALTVIAAPVAFLLATDPGSPVWQFSELLPGKSPSREEPLHTIWLGAVTGVLLAILLIGVSHAALQVESSRVMTSPRNSAFPSRSRIRNVLELNADRERSISLIDLATGRRADVFLLLGILAFVCVASMLTTSPENPADNESHAH